MSNTQRGDHDLDLAKKMLAVNDQTEREMIERHKDEMKRIADMMNGTCASVNTMQDWRLKNSIAHSLVAIAEYLRAQTEIMHRSACADVDD